MRLGLVLILAAAALPGEAPAAAAPRQAATASDGVRLRTYPVQTYFTSANDKERIAGSIFFLILEMPDKSAATPVSLQLTYRDGASVVKVEELRAPALESIDNKRVPPSMLNPPGSPKVTWPHAFRLFVTLPESTRADRIAARLTYRSGNRQRYVEGTIPIVRYVQRTRLIFPFKGEGIVSVGGAMAGGHRNRSGLHAIDALGLAPTYGPMRTTGNDLDPANYVGWGRPVIAPAGGKIVIARSDRPDQPVAEKSDPAFYAPEHPDGGDPGNFIVIDHDNGEFSMIAHLQKDSVRVRPGDSVAQGQALGLLGNSGDTTGPHVHYQLQNGADWQRSDGLPVSFVDIGTPVRGGYFSAK